MKAFLVCLTHIQIRVDVILVDLYQLTLDMTHTHIHSRIGYPSGGWITSLITVTQRRYNPISNGLLNRKIEASGKAEKEAGGSYGCISSADDEDHRRIF